MFFSYYVCNWNLLLIGMLGVVEGYSCIINFVDNLLGGLEFVYIGLVFLGFLFWMIFGWGIDDFFNLK